MVQITKYYNINESDSSPLPLLNSLFINTQSSVLSSTGEDLSYKTYMNWARKSPHIMGLINIIATDIISDNIKFKPVDGSGRNRVKKAKDFWVANRGIDVCEETIYDMLLNGIGYNWVGKMPVEEVKEVCREMVHNKFPKLEGKEFEFKAEQVFNEVLNQTPMAKKLRYMASSTVSLKHDQHEITAIVQNVGGRVKVFSPDEVIIFRLMPLDGKVYPYPPMESLLTQVYLIWLISQNYVSYFENGGHPDKVFILPKEIAGSKNHELLIETLKKYKKIQNKHGNLVFTGDIKIEDLMKVDSTMDHQDLGLYIVSVMAMFYGIPVGRIPFLIGKAANNGDAGGLADSGYWRKISVWQSKIEHCYNNELFIPYFGVEMEFSRGYKQDEVRETQNEMNKTTIAEQRMRMGLWTPEAAGEYLGIDPEIVVAAQKKKEEELSELMNKSGMLKQNDETNSNVMEENDSRSVNIRRQEKQNKNYADKGMKKLIE